MANPITFPGIDRYQPIPILRHADGGYSAFGRRAHMKSGGSRAECARCLCLIGSGCAETLGWIISVPGYRGVRAICWHHAEITDTAEPTPARAAVKAPTLQPREADSVEGLRTIFFQAMKRAKHTDQAVAYAVGGSLMRRARDAEEAGDTAEAARILRDYLAQAEARISELRGRIDRGAFAERRATWEAAELEQIALDVRTLIDKLSR